MIILLLPIVFLVFTFLIIKIINSIDKDNINNKIYFYIFIQNFIFLLLVYYLIKFIYFNYLLNLFFS